MNDVDMKLVIAIARVQSELFSRIDRNVSEFGLNTSEFGVLELLLHNGPQPVQTVAEKILVTSGTISYTLDKLEKKGLVARTRDERDKRVFKVSLTEKGDILIGDAFPKHREFIQELLGGLEPEHKEDLLRMLLQMRRTIKGD